MGDESPLVSIITSVLNGADTLQRTIDSVHNQTYNYIEYIIIDGNSSDGTINILEKNSERISYWISEDDDGIYHAWNKGLNKVQGNWILFLGSGDILHPDAISDMIKVTGRLKGQIEYVSGKSEIRDANDKLIAITGEPWEWATFKKYMCTAQSGALHSIELFKKYGQFDESYKVAGDYEFLLRAGNKLKSSFIDKVVVTFYLGGVSNRNNKGIWEAYHAKVKHVDTWPLFNKIFAFKAILIRYLKAY